MMTASSRRELYKLRELVHFLLQGAGATPRSESGYLCCYFCKVKLDEYGKEFEKHGNSVGPKFLEKISIHHVDGNHDNNVLLNKALAHVRCHKGWHRRLANEARAGMQEKMQEVEK